MGYHASWHDTSAGTFHCSIVDGGEAGPVSAIATVPAGSEASPEVRDSSPRDLQIAVAPKLSASTYMLHVAANSLHPVYGLSSELAPSTLHDAL